MRVGILALQGGYAAHQTALQQLNIEQRLITQPEQLASIDRLIMPGGESSTMLKFLSENQFFSVLKQFGQTKPIFGTCAGAILLANDVHHPEQMSLGLIDIGVERNSYGRQLQSHVDQGEYLPENRSIEMVFIRAPRIVRVGDGVKVLATCCDEPVAVQQGHILAATFHPELSADLSLHQLFCRL